MAEFNIGDKIIITKRFDGMQKGVTGTIVAPYVAGGSYIFGIEVDEEHREKLKRYCSLHILSGKLNTLTGYWVQAGCWEHYYKEVKYDPNQLPEDGDI